MLDRGRVRIAGGIGDADLVAACGHQRFGQPQYLRLRNRAFQRAAEGSGQAALELGAVVGGQVADHGGDLEIGRAAWRAGVCQYEYSSVVGGNYIKKNDKKS